MFFVNDTLGYMGDNGLKIYKTINAGLTWTPTTYNSSNSSPPLNDVRKIYYSSVDTGFVLTYGMVYKTVNGGANFNRVLNLSVSTGDMHFINSKYGIVTGDAVNYKINAHVTYDGGATWANKYYPFSAFSVFAFDSLTTYLCGYNCSIIRTGPQQPIITTGIKESVSLFKNDVFKLYPNPANSFITVSTADENTITKYKIFDILGHEVMSGELLKESTINILKLTDGVYLLEIQGNRTKFVIDR